MIENESDYGHPIGSAIGSALEDIRCGDFTAEQVLVQLAADVALETVPSAEHLQFLRYCGLRADQVDVAMAYIADREADLPIVEHTARR